MKLRIFLTLTILLIIYTVTFDFLRWIQYDSPSFTGGSRLLFGLEGGYDFQSRLTKPLFLVLPGFFEWITGLKPEYIFLAQNVIFFYLSGFLIFNICRIVFNDHNLAFFGMLIYASCQPFAVYSLFILSDVAGWFFGLLCIYFVVKYSGYIVANLKYSIISGLIAGTGCLFKESAVTGLIFAICYVVFADKSIMKKILPSLAMLISFMVPLTLSYLINRYFYNDTVLTRIKEAHTATANDFMPLSYYLKQTFRVIDYYWFLFIPGMALMISDIFQKKINILLIVFLAAAAVTFTVTHIWPYYNDRIVFMAAPFIVVISVYGLTLFKQFKLPVVLICGFLNILVTYLIYKNDTSGLLIMAGVTVLFIILTFLAVLYWKMLSGKLFKHM